MARKYVYYCDQCEASFGNHSHLNFKGTHIFKSNKDTFGRWHSGKISLGDEDKHFCDHHCFCGWIKERMKLANS